MADLLKLLAPNGLPLGVGLMMALMYLTDRQSRRSRETTAGLIDGYRDLHDSMAGDLDRCRMECDRLQAVIRELVMQNHAQMIRIHELEMTRTLAP